MCIKHDGRVYKGIINCKYDRLLHIYIFTTRLSANKIKAINSFTEIAIYRIHDALNIYFIKTIFLVLHIIHFTFLL